MEPSRRKVVRELVGVLAAAAVGGTLAGATTIGAPAEAHTLDAKAWIGDLELRLAGLDAMSPDGPVATLLSARGHAPDLLPRVAKAMTVASSFRDLPERVQRDARVQDLVWAQAPAMTEAIFELSDVLAGLTEDERAQVGRALREDPSILAEVDDGLVRATRRRNVHEGRVRQLREWTHQVGWQLRSQPPTVVVDRTLRRMDRVCRSFGFRRTDWRAASTTGFARRAPRADTQHDPAVTAGLVIMGIGGGLLGLGLLLFVVGLGAESALTVVGILVGLLGIAILLIGVIVWAIATGTTSDPRPPPRLAPQGP